MLGLPRLPTSDTGFRERVGPQFIVDVHFGSPGQPLLHCVHQPSSAPRLEGSTWLLAPVVYGAEVTRLAGAFFNSPASAVTISFSGHWPQKPTTINGNGSWEGPWLQKTPM